MSRLAALIILLVCTSCAVAVEGSAKLAFRIDEPFSEVVRKLDSERSLCRMLQSQEIELLAIERISRRFSMMPATVDAKFMIDMRARRFSNSTGQILQAVSVGVAKARLQFELAQPVGRIASQRYTVDLTSRAGATEVEIEIYSRVFVPCRRLRFVQQLTCRIARQRILDELGAAIIAFGSELQAIASEKLPVRSKPLLFAAAG